MTNDNSGFSDRYYTEFEMREEIRVARRQGEARQMKITAVIAFAAAIFFVLPIVSLAIQNQHLTNAQRETLSYMFH